MLLSIKGEDAPSLLWVIVSSLSPPLLKALADAGAVVGIHWGHRSVSVRRGSLGVVCTSRAAHGCIIFCFSPTSFLISSSESIIIIASLVLIASIGVDCDKERW